MRFSGVRLGLAALFALALATPLMAFHPVEESTYWEIPRLGAPSQLTWETHRAGPLESTALGSLIAAHGGHWRYQVNRLTGTYHHVYGSGIDLGRPLHSAEEVEGVARAFIRDHQDVFSIGNGDLEVMNNAHGAGKWSIIFQQMYEGLEVWGGRAHLVFTDSGRLFAMGSDVYPGIRISTTPALSELDALAEAKSSIGFQEGLDRVESTKFQILPVEMEEGELEYRLAYRFDLRTENPFGIWATWVDASTGEILWRENHMRFVDFAGHSQGDVEWESYCDGITPDYPMINMRINISGVGTAYCDVNGDFVLPYGGTDSKTITADFRSYWVDLNRYGGGDASHSGTITPGVPYTIDWTQANSIYSERDVYSAVNKEHDWLKDIDPDWAGMDFEMDAWVERTDGYCPGNAWYDLSLHTINLCVSSSSYGNTGRMMDVIYHEYGHGITDFLYGAYDPPSDCHEGNSDIVANLLTRESIIGLGFYLNNCTSGIRNSDNTMQWPCSGSGHTCGQVIAGFIWDSWQELQAAYPQAYADSVIRHDWHFGRKLGLPQSQPDQVYWTFVADDDDGDLDNGTPHHAQLCVGATNHSFDCPEIMVGVFITHTPLENTMDTTNPYPVVAQITSTEGGIDTGTLRVSYRVDGGAFSDVGMTATGNPDEYIGYIPAQVACSKVEYYIYAEDEMGNVKSDPPDAPTHLHMFVVGYEIVFQDDFEDDKGWTVGAPGDDASTGVWERCDPDETTYGATVVQPGDDHTPAPGTLAYITQCAGGSNAGSYDVDGGQTTLLSPVLDLTDYTDAAVVYWRWYTNDSGDNPASDYWVVDVSDDGGSTWHSLENTTSSLHEWAEMQFDLTPYLTDQVQFRFIASDEGGGSLVEAGVDDFKILACSRNPDSEPPTVEVLDPNGGEELIGGQPYDIHWNASDNVGVTLTTILWSTDGGATYPTEIASGPTLTSPYTWDVPDVDESACRIQVVAQDGALNTGLDESDGDFEITLSTGVADMGSLPPALVLRQNQPNPFNPVTEIEFGLPSAQRIALEIYDVSGRLVSTLATGVYSAGYHTAVWRGTDDQGAEVSTGVYFYRLVTEEKVMTKKMLMLK